MHMLPYAGMIMIVLVLLVSVARKWHQVKLADRTGNEASGKQIIIIPAMPINNKRRRPAISIGNMHSSVSKTLNESIVIVA